jgi:hypothetical protein
MRIAWLTRHPGGPVVQLLSRLAPEVDVRTAGGGDGPDDRLAVVDLSDAAGGDRRVLALGWATVELDRAAGELDGIDQRGGRPVALGDDPLLGARCRLIAPREGGPDVILLEPATEGRIAASLARFGEGPAALYVSGGPGGLAGAIEWIRRSGGIVSRAADGPFGRSALILGGQAWGPHVVLVDEPDTGGAGPGTIDL